MFDKNGSFLFKAKIMFIILFFTIMAVIIALAIICFVGEAVVEGISILVAGGVTLMVYFVLVCLMMSVLIDIKHIRNKLYDCEQKELNNFWGRTVNNSNISPYDERVKKYEALKALAEALKSGAVSEEEYEEQRKEILGE